MSAYLRGFGPPSTPLLAGALLVLILGAGTRAGAAADATTIAKCRDAQGHWHYGDAASSECARSKIIELNQEGVATKEIAAPPTAADRRRRARAQERAKAERSQAERDKRLLSMYAVADDITYVRNRKLAEISDSIKANEETIESLQAALARLQAQATQGHNRGNTASPIAKDVAFTQEQIATHEATIAAKRREQDRVRRRYNAELARYRELKHPKALPGAVAVP